jgi:hypothetical protein
MVNLSLSEKNRVLINGIQLRAIHRLVDFITTSEDQPNYLQEHQWSFCALDTFPVLGQCRSTLVIEGVRTLRMVVAWVVFIFFHPGYYLPPEMTRLVFKRPHTSKNDYMRPGVSDGWIPQPVHHTRPIPHPYERTDERWEG